MSWPRRGGGVTSERSASGEPDHGPEQSERTRRRVLNLADELPVHGLWLRQRLSNRQDRRIGYLRLRQSLLQLGCWQRSGRGGDYRVHLIAPLTAVLIGAIPGIVDQPGQSESPQRRGQKAGVRVAITMCPSAVS